MVVYIFSIKYFLIFKYRNRLFSDLNKFRNIFRKLLKFAMIETEIEIGTNATSNVIIVTIFKIYLLTSMS